MPDLSPLASATRALMLAAAESPRELIPVRCPEIGVTAYVAAMTGSERDEWEQAIAQDRQNNGGLILNMRAITVAIGAKDADGKRMFGLRDVPALGRLPFAPLDRIATAVLRAGKMTEADAEDAEKN